MVLIYTTSKHALYRIKTRARKEHMSEKEINNWVNQILKGATEVSREGSRLTMVNRAHTFIVDAIKREVITYYMSECVKEIEESKYHVKYKDTLRKLRDSELKKLLKTERELLINYHQKVINSLRVFNPNTLDIINNDIQEIENRLTSVREEKDSLLILDNLYNL